VAALTHRQTGSTDKKWGGGHDARGMRPARKERIGEWGRGDPPGSNSEAGPPPAQMGLQEGTLPGLGARAGAADEYGIGAVLVRERWGKYDARGVERTEAKLGIKPGAHDDLLQ
jgi:hypothetical protein